jgi:hypothetical protein
MGAAAILHLINSFEMRPFRTPTTRKIAVADFWKFIDEQRVAIPAPVDSHEYLFLEAIEALGKEVRIAYGREYWTALTDLDKMESWEAVSLLSGTYCGDDSFLYFRNWVIWQGRDIKELFVKDPDGLLKLAHQNQLPISEPFVECLTALNAYNQGSTASRPATEFNPKWNWQESSVQTMASHLPSLWSVYGESFKERLASPPPNQEEFIEGLGTLGVGDKVRHLVGFGVGVIKGFPVAGRDLALIEFEDQERCMAITCEFFERE